VGASKSVSSVACSGVARRAMRAVGQNAVAAGAIASRASAVVNRTMVDCCVVAIL